MTTPTPVPGIPSWPTTPVTSQTPTSKKPTDWWGLGQEYGQPVFVGTVDTGGPVSFAGGPAKAELGAGGEHVTADKWVPTENYMQAATQLWTKDPVAYAQLQQQLAQAGYYGKTEQYVPGRFDKITRSALTGMLKDYEATRRSGSPVTVSEFLRQTAATTQAALQVAPQKPTVTTDPTMIRAAAQQAFVAATGHSASEKQLDAFVGQFQTAQQAYETSTNSTVARPDLSADASAFAQQADPQAYQGHQAEAYTNALVNLLVPGAQRPSIGTVAPA